MTGDFTDQDLLANGDDADASVDELFKLNINNTLISNDYFMKDPTHIMIEGGSLYNDGAAGEDYVPSEHEAGSGDPDPTPGEGIDPADPDPTPGEGIDPTDPDPTPGGGTDPVDPNPTPGGGNTPRNGGADGKKSGLWIQVGADAGEKNGITIYLPGVSAKILGIDKVDISTVQGALDAIDIVKEAIHTVSSQRSQIGAYQNRLEHTVNNLDNIIENTIAAESCIRDTDMAKAMVEFSRMNILEQTAQAMLSHANQKNHIVLGLLQ